MSDFTDTIQAYEAWKAGRQYPVLSDAEQYEEHLKTQEELRILNAIRIHFDTTTDSYISFSSVRDALAGKEPAINDLEASSPW